MSNEHLKIDSLFFKYQTRNILNNVSFALNKGEIGVILGPSGSGKTTILRIIAGLEKSQKGNVLLNQQKVDGESSFVDPQHRKVGYVFQDYALFPHLTVSQNILFGLSGIEKSLQTETLAKMLHLFKLENEKNKYPHQLSGGQQQRVAIARSLAPAPEILLLDEPFSNLDLNMREELIFELRSIFKSLNITALFVTHDVGEAFSFADKIGVLKNGSLLQWSSPDAIFNTPNSKEVAEILQSGNFLEGEIKNGKFNSFFGECLNLLLPDNLKKDQKCCLFLPHGSIMINDKGQFTGKIIKVNFTGKVVHLKLGYMPDATFSIIELSNFSKKPQENCRFDINFAKAVIFDL